jgi:hypothetical protein
MLFVVGKAKKDQEGTCNIDHHPWHLYGNTKHPNICCFLAVGWHLISNPTILAGRCAMWVVGSMTDSVKYYYLRCGVGFEV